MLDDLRHYTPCDIGLHVCAINADGEGFVTVVNFPTETKDAATKLFEAVKGECEARDGEPDDLIVDLNTGLSHPNEGLVDTFDMPRQMLDRLRDIASRALSDGGAQ